MNVYRIQAKHRDGAVDYSLSHFVEGRIGNTHPAYMGTYTDYESAMSDVVADVDECLHTEFRVDANLHDGGSMETGATCLRCGMVGCDTPYWMDNPAQGIPKVGPIEQRVRDFHCSIDETDY